MSAEATHCYVGRLACGCAVTVVVDSPEYAKFTARDIAKMVRSGQTVNRVTLEDFRASNFGHEQKACPTCAPKIAARKDTR